MSAVVTNQIKQNRKFSISALVDNKRKHLERGLSAAQLDKILIDKSKEDAMFRREMAVAMKESTKKFSSSVKRLRWLRELVDRLEKLAEVMSFQASTNQNMFYQNIHHQLTPPTHQGYYRSM